MEQAIKFLQEKKAEIKRSLQITREFIEVTPIRYITVDIIDLELKLAREIKKLDIAIIDLQKI